MSEAVSRRTIKQSDGPFQDLLIGIVSGIFPSLILISYFSEH